MKLFPFPFLFKIAAGAAQGRWQSSGTTGVVCIATALLPDSRLLCFERPHMTPYPINPFTSGALATEINLKAHVNPDGTWTSSFMVKPIENNPFCAGLSLLSDGSVFIAGGDNQDWPSINGQTRIVNGRLGLRNYTPCATEASADCSGEWKILNDMTTERWYPTVITLGDGRVMIIGGQTKNIDFENLKPTDNNPTYEYYPTKSGNWPRTLEILQWSFPYNLYAPSFVMPSGRVVVIVSNKTIAIDPKDDTITNLPDMPLLDHAPWIYPHTPTAVILPMTIANNYAFEILICGGSKSSNDDASNSCLKINPDDSNPQWSVVESMPNARLMGDTVLMVNGLKGGQGGGNQGQAQYARIPIYETDVFDPTATGSKWSTIGVAKEMRLYHSGALLMDTGHVITVGSEMNNYNDYWTTRRADCFVNIAERHTSPLAGTGCTDPFNYNIERFTPPYLLKSTSRIEVTNAPKRITYGSQIKVVLDKDANDVSMVTFIRFSSLTHSTNTDQRFIELKIAGRDSKNVYITFPSNPGQAPPGNWFLFVLSKDGVPSIAATVNLMVGEKVINVVPNMDKNGGPITSTGILSIIIPLFIAFNLI